MDSRPTVVLQDVASKEERILPLYEVEEEEGQAYGHLDWDSVTKGFNASQVEIEGTGVPAVFRSGSQEGLTIDWFHSGTIVDKSGLRAGNWIHSGTVIKVNIEKQAAMPQLFSFQDHFKKLLKQASVNQPDSKVIDAIARHLPAHMMAAGSPTRALDLYERGKLIPGVSTQEQLLVQHQIRVGGPYFLQYQEWSASLLKGVDGQGRPCVVKFLAKSVRNDDPEQPGGSEARACRALLPGAETKGIPLIEGELLELTLPETHRSTGRTPGRYAALVSPQYCWSVGSSLQLPEEAIEAGARRMVSALAYIHQKGMVHMDVKSDNVFIDMEGQWFLGDFGSTVPVGERVFSTTGWFTSFDLIGSPAKEEYDWYMLAVMVAVELNRGDWRDRLIVESHTPPAKLVAALQVAKRATFLDLVQEILRRADVPFS